MLTAEEVTMQEMEDTIDCQEQFEQGRFLDVGSNYMALAGISHEEMMQQAHILGFVAVTGTEHVEDERPKTFQRLKRKHQSTFQRLGK